MARARSGYKRKHDALMKEKFLKYLAYFNFNKGLVDLKKGQLRIGNFIQAIEKYPDNPSVQFPDKNSVTK